MNAEQTQTLLALLERIAVALETHNRSAAFQAKATEIIAMEVKDFNNRTKSPFDRTPDIVVKHWPLNAEGSK
jgi:hypothetical protein